MMVNLAFQKLFKNAILSDIYGTRQIHLFLSINGPRISLNEVHVRVHRYQCSAKLPGIQGPRQPWKPPPAHIHALHSLVPSAGVTS